MTTAKPIAAALNVTLLLWTCIVAANFFNVDASVVGMIAPTLISGLGASSSLVSLTSAIFTLMVAAFLLGGAALGDIYGRKRIMTIGIIGETAMAVLAMLTPSVTLLLPIRLVAGIFAALISPTALALVTVNFAAGPARTKAIGLYVVAFGVVGSLASVVIQALNQTISWRAPFALIALWGAISVLLVLRFVAESKATGQRRMDWIGTGLAAVGLFLLLFGINNAGALGFTSPGVIVPSLAGLCVIAILVIYSGRVPQPVFQVKLFKSNVFAFGLLLGVMLNVGYSAAAYQANLLMQAVVKVPPVLAAIYLLPLAGGYLLASPLPSRLHGKLPTSLLLLIGSAILAVGVYLFGFLSAPQINVLTYLVPGLLLGLGMGMAQSFKTSAVLGTAPPELAGAASATNNVSNNLGASLAVALSSAFMGSFVITAYGGILAKAGVTASQIQTAISGLQDAMSKSAGELATQFDVPVQVVYNLDVKATQAYIQGLTETMLVIAVATLLVAIAVFFILRRKEAEKVQVVTPAAGSKQRLTMTVGARGGVTMPEAAASSITVFTAQKFITMDPSQPAATAVAVRDGRILEVGTLESIHPWLELYPYTIDTTFAGKVVMPGFIDPHMHPLLGGMLLNAAWITPEPWDLPWGDIAPTHGRAVYLARLQDLFAADTGTGQFFMTWGYHPFWHGAVTRQDLDAISATRPIYVSHRSFHEGIFNTAALDLLKMTAEQFKDNAQADYANGHFVEDAFIRLVLPRVSAYLLPPDAVAESMCKTLMVLHAGGITTVADMSTGSTNWALETTVLAQTFDREESPARVRLTPDVFALAASLGSPAKALEFIAGLPAHNTRHVIAGNAVKLFADGAFFSQRMQMNWPAYMDGHQGEWLTVPEQFEALARLCWNAGCQIHVHTNGDLGLDLVLDTLERLWNEKPRINHRFTIEHFGCSTSEQCRRIADLGALVSANVFYLYDMSAQYATSGLGYERASQMARIGALARNGVTTTYHSDFPMAPMQPLVWAWGAVNRFNLDGTVMAPAERVTVDQAMKAITIDAAYVLHMENEIGSIRCGKLADFTVLEQDPYAVAAEQIKDIKVWGTVFEGKVFPLTQCK